VEGLLTNGGDLGLLVQDATQERQGLIDAALEIRGKARSGGDGGEVVKKTLDICEDFGHGEIFGFQGFGEDRMEAGLKEKLLDSAEGGDESVDARKGGRGGFNDRAEVTDGGEKGKNVLRRG
jgi:hypothetical protein